MDYNKKQIGCNIISDYFHFGRTGGGRYFYHRKIHQHSIQY